MLSVVMSSQVVTNACLISAIDVGQYEANLCR